MVTKPGREHLATRAITAFSQASWDDKELVIASDGDPSHVAQLTGTHLLAGAPVRVILAESGATLGHLRNRCLEEATGEFVIQWDDDDYYHPLRIPVQIAPMIDNPAAACTCLTDQLYVFETGDQIDVAWVDWARRGVDPRPSSRDPD